MVQFSYSPLFVISQSTLCLFSSPIFPSSSLYHAFPSFFCSLTFYFHRMQMIEKKKNTKTEEGGIQTCRLFWIFYYFLSVRKLSKLFFPNPKPTRNNGIAASLVSKSKGDANIYNGFSFSFSFIHIPEFGTGKLEIQKEGKRERKG